MFPKSIAFAGCLLVLFPTMAAAQEVAAGQRVFQQRCAACHTVQAGQNRVGPNLAAAFGSTAGSVEGARYSDAMKKSGLIWDEDTLSRYLDNPRGVVPNSTMTVNLRDAKQRADVIAYLKSLGAPPATP